MSEISDCDLKFLDSNYHLGVKECARLLNTTESTVRDWNRKYKVYTRLLDRRILISRFHNIAEPEIAYFLGLLWADGYVSKGKYIQLEIGLKIEDFTDLQPLFDKIGEFKFYIKKPQRYSPNFCKCLKTSHRNLNIFLKENDFCEKSHVSPDKILDKIPENLKKYWWRGYFDGDGHVKVDEAGRWGFVFCSTFDQDWSFGISLMNTLGVDYRIRRIIKTASKNSIMSCQNKDGFLKFFNYIYSDYDNIGLKRKYSSYRKGLDLIEKCNDSLKRRSKPILYYTENWEHLGRCDSIRSLARVLNISASHIRSYFKKNKKHCCHYQFKKE